MKQFGLYVQTSLFLRFMYAYEVCVLTWECSPLRGVQVGGPQQTRSADTEEGVRHWSQLSVSSFKVMVNHNIVY